MDKIKILFIGDVIGKSGRKFLLENLNSIKFEKKIDFIILNGENSSGGIGITPKTCELYIKNGINVITSGNHIWRYKEIYPYLDNSNFIIRPLNYSKYCPGKGFVTKIINGINITVINLLGNVFINEAENPFLCIEKFLETNNLANNIIIIDFHAEATSEKISLGHFLDGKVTAVLGTHTHIQTSDAKILPNGTGYVTDVGMTGPENSVIGMEKETVIKRFLSSMPVKFKVADSKIMLNSVILTIDKETRKTDKIEYLNLLEA